MKRLVTLLLVAGALAGGQNLISKPEADDGWLLLFDGSSLFGWTAESEARWATAGGVLAPVSDASLLRTNSAFSDFTLKLDYRTNSSDADCGVYARSAIDGQPQDTGYRIQIGDAKSEWPSGSIVEHFKAEASRPAVGQWHSLEANFLGDHISVTLDGRKVADGQNSRAKAGVIVLGCNKSGIAQFRNIKLRPSLTKQLFNGTDLSGWKQVGPPPPKKAGMLKKMLGGGGKAKEAQWSVLAGAMHGGGGLGQLETTAMYDDFVLQLAIRVNAHEKTDRPQSSLFLRGDAGQLSTGYELPVLNQYRDGNRAQALPESTGALRGLETPRKVMSDDNQYFTETIAAYGRHIQVWVNGYPVSDFQDTRAEGTSPQKEARTTAGTVSLFSADEKANLDFRNVKIAQMPKLLGKGPAEATTVQPPPPAVPTSPLPSQPGAMAPPADPNKPRIQALMNQALTTDDPQKLQGIYTQILELDPNNAVAFNGLQQAKQKIDEQNQKRQEEQQKEQQQSESQAQAQSEGQAARQNAVDAFERGDLDTANAQIKIADKDLSGNGDIADLRARIEAAIQQRTRLRFLWGGIGIAGLIALITAFIANRGKKIPILEVIDGPDKGKRFNLDQDVVHIGAIAQDGGNKNEIVLRDLGRQISRFHCEIHKRGGKFYLIDCGSANGTRVDGNRAQPNHPVRLKSRARLEVAGTCALRMGWEKRRHS